MGTEILPVEDCGLTLVMLPDGTVRRPINLADQWYWHVMGIQVFRWTSIGFDVIDDVQVSTAFLPIDHAPLSEWAHFEFDPFAAVPVRGRFPDGHVPTCFETMVFGGPMGGYTRRYKSLKKARFWHKLICLEVRYQLDLLADGGVPPEPAWGDYDIDYFGTPYQ